MKQTVSMLCRACFLSGASPGHLSSSLLCGEFHQTADRDVIRTDAELIYKAQQKDKQLFVCVCVCVCV